MGPHKSNKGRAVSASRVRLSKYHSQLERKRKGDALHLIISGLTALKVLRTLLKKAELEMGVQTADIMIEEFEDYLK